MSVTDWKYPLSYSESDGRVDMNGLENDIKQSLYLLLSTKKGERICRPNYGCNLSQFAFENINYTLISRIEGEITQAIKQYEPRVENVSISLDSSSKSEITTETLLINVQYTVKATAAEQTLQLALSENY